MNDFKKLENELNLTLFVLSINSGNKVVQLPNLVGLTLEQAEFKASELGLTVKFIEENNIEIPNELISSPELGELIKITIETIEFDPTYNFSYDNEELVCESELVEVEKTFIEENGGVQFFAKKEEELKNFS